MFINEEENAIMDLTEENVAPEIEDACVECNAHLGVVKNCKSLNVRIGPSMDSEVIHVLNCGDVVVVNDDPVGDFYKVTVETLLTHIEGYCMTKFIEVDPSELVLVEN